MQIHRLLWKFWLHRSGWGPLSVFFHTSTTVENVYSRKAGWPWPLQFIQWNRWPSPYSLEVNCGLSPTPRLGFGGVAEREWCQEEHIHHSLWWNIVYGSERPVRSLHGPTGRVLFRKWFHLWPTVFVLQREGQQSGCQLWGMKINQLKIELGHLASWLGVDSISL